MSSVFVLPGSVADCLPLASAEQLRVLLWFSRRNGWDAAACAADLKMDAATCEGCLYFWVEQGVLVSDGAAPAVVATPVQEHKSAPRAAAVKPLWKEVLAYQQEHKEFSAFLEEVSARMGRPLNQGDNATLLYLITTAGIPAVSVLMAVGYAVSIGKGSIRYVEGLALGWADEDITTPEQVDGKIRELQRTRAAAEKVEQALGLPRALTAAQAKMADRWLNLWHFSDGMLQHAHTSMLEHCEKPNLNYMDKILERWHAEGIATPDRIAAPAAPKKKGAGATNPEESSLDNRELEEQLLRYRPKFNKK
jgi:DnaD/phage-associated family protein